MISHQRQFFVLSSLAQLVFNDQYFSRAGNDVPKQCLLTNGAASKTLSNVRLATVQDVSEDSGDAVSHEVHDV